ncbi:glycoside hydrolase family 2 TIM barrel-domain containing protein [Cohnella sp. JJ-181]|uniref:glycoside hydrolase family 2 TIM barrel-domain containing protein n=1 Tax=Cohnella rhizoplanae TaxID=2974897 RepID=UPI0022FF52D0|nr:glycoside hydrolase family 2 TIM barrel-domain containing protein [Cohnella sp. JJ-181]CAI6086498.1 Beta-galactosidase [Cohnella sp. JJ-181]
MKLDGEWRFLLDRDDRYADAPPPDDAFGEGNIRVPGSWEEQGYGDEPPYGQIDTWTKVREYEGAAWYRTTFRIGDGEARADAGSAAAIDAEGSGTKGIGTGGIGTGGIGESVKTADGSATAAGRSVGEPDGAADGLSEAFWELTIAGARWTTQVWLNGAYAGSQDSLSAPHAYRLDGTVRLGVNELDIRVDNRMRLPLSDSHIHTRHTATAWGGITGGVRLRRLARARVEAIAIEPEPEAGVFRCRVRAGGEIAAGDTIVATFRAPDGGIFRASAELSPAGPVRSHDSQGGHGGHGWRGDGGGHGSSGCEVAEFAAELTCALGDAPALWSDARPLLYEAEFALIRDGETLDRKTRRTGLRRLTADGKRLLLNGHPIWLRGYVDCCIFPLTGYPVWDKAHYERQFRIAKSYGFNHVRLHGWTAPEPFWEAADEAGMLVQTELPHWSAYYQPREATPPADVDAFLESELRRIYAQLNAHPSFVLFAPGNELAPDNGHPRLNELVRLARELDPTRLATDNTGFGQLPEQDREGDFFIPSFNWHVPLKTEEIAMPATDRDFSAVARLSAKPVIGHEHAQFTMYARPEEKEKYTGVLRPTWLETIEETLEAKGLAARVPEWIEATGVHQIRALKEAMERARRTPDAAGVQLLDIRDFPGQGHATTGLLDVFWDSKGTIAPERALDFNGPTVLLMSCPARTLFAGERMPVRLLVSHYGEAPVLKGRVAWRLSAGEETIGSGEMEVAGLRAGEVAEIGVVHVGSGPERAAARIALEARWLDDGATTSDAAIRNSWSFWSFPRPRPADSDATVWTSAPALKTVLYGAIHEPNASFDPRFDPARRGVRLAVVERLTTNVLQHLVAGGRVLLLAGEPELYDAVTTKYLPVFWNYLMFSEQAGGTMGAIVRDHPALGGFPHEGASDWHWYHLLNGTPAICLDAAPGIRPIVEIVDNFNRAKRLAAVFEARVGAGRLLVSTLAWRTPADFKRPESAYLFAEMLNYALGDRFEPETTLTVGQVLGMVRLRGIHSFL